ncbi:MAG TPA: hypothetical protein DDZ51_06335 [Planctomycetaceae bacterium]|nr:hypothetical protein [Planctomycetaceae bacterium]
MKSESLIDSMSRTGQSATVQTLWDRLSACPQGTAPPDWYDESLAERLASLEQGSAKLVDWTDTQKRRR